MDGHNSVWSNLTSWVRGQSEPPSMDGEIGAHSTIPMIDGASLQPVLEPLTSTPDETPDDDTASVTSLGLRDLFLERRVNFAEPEETADFTMGPQHPQLSGAADPTNHEEPMTSPASQTHEDKSPEDQRHGNGSQAARPYPGGHVSVSASQVGYRYSPPSVATRSDPRNDPTGWHRMFNATPGGSLTHRPPAPEYESTRRSEARPVANPTTQWMRGLLSEDRSGARPTSHPTPLARIGSHVLPRMQPASMTPSIQWSRPAAYEALPSYVTGTGTMLARREKDVRPFDGKGDLYDYLNYFMTVSRLNGWDYTICGLQLATSLTGKASEVLTTMPAGEAEDFTCLVRALVCRFRPQGQDSQFSVALMGRSWNAEKESITDYCHDLRRLARQAYPVEGVSESILVDLFRKGLNHEMQQQLNIQRPRDLDSALAIALAMEPFHKGKGHKKPSNPEVVPVAAVGATGRSGQRSYRGKGRGGHFPGPGRRIPASQIDMFQKWKANRCFHCWEIGHYQKDCPKKPEAEQETSPQPPKDGGDQSNALN
jgi:hypothetical protein